MKITKKFLSVFLALLMIVSIIPMSSITAFAEDSATSGTCGENVIWAFDESTGTLTISGIGKMKSFISVSRPWAAYKDSIISVIIDDGVTKIGEDAFSGYFNLKNVTIGNGITKIGATAFSDCDSLTSITIPDSVITIGVAAFEECDSLKNITIGDRVTTIEGSAFSGCDSLTSIIIPDGVITIGNYAFAYCTNLTSIIIGDGVTTIGHSAFRYCDSLTNMTIPDSVTTIEEYAFEDCDNLKNVTIGDSVTTIGNYAFQDCVRLSNITIPDSVITIGNYAFDNCNSLTIVTINGVKTIGVSAFSDCDSLKNIIIPDNVITINKSAFKNCDSLTDVYYTGTAEDWNDISIGSENDPLLNATIHFLGEETQECLYESVVTPPTCTEQGYTTYTCSCGDSYISDYVPATGHNYVNGICTYCNSNNANNPTDPDIPLEENMSGLFVFSDNISLSYMVGDVILLAVTQMEDNNYTIPEKLSLSLMNSSVVELIDIYDYNDLKNGTFSWLFSDFPEEFKNCCFVTLKAKKEGMTEFVLTNSDTKDTFRSYLTVSNDKYATFRADNVPTGVLDGEQYNYIIDAMVVTDFICEKTGGGYKFKMDIYNQQYSLGVVEVYNADGTLRQVEKIDKFASSTNVKGVFLDGYYLIKSFAKGELMTFKGSQIAKENKIEVFVPQDGFIRITNDSAVSTSCYLLNLFDIILSAGDVISGTKSLSAEQIDIVGKEVIKKFISNTYYLETAKKYQENMSKLAAEKITESVTLSLISQAGDIAEGLLMEIDLDFGDICKEALGTSFEIAEDIFTKVSGPAGLALSGMMTLQKVMNYVTQMGDWMNTTNNQAYYCIMTPSDSNYSSGILTSPDGIKVDTQGNVSSEVILQTVRILKGDETTLSLNEMSLVDDYVLYDISLVKNGQEVQPNGTVVVYLNVPSGFGENITVFRQVNDSVWEGIDATVENGIIRLEIDHFCKFAFVSVGNFEIQTPSRTEIRNKDGIILHAIVDGTAPTGSYVRWESNNGNFDEDANGYDLEIIAKNKGWTTFTAILCDADGKELARSSVEMYSKSGFFDKIGGFFRSLFGTTKVYDA